MNDQTLEYFTVISDKPHILDDNVNEKLAQGWQLQGGVANCPVRAGRALWAATHMC
jgi:hypothetical protein